MNERLQNDGSTYATKMDDIITEATNKWWKSLTKQELLKYMEEQECITADHIRDMMSNVNGVLAFDIRFGLSESIAAIDFHIGSGENSEN